ncbi:hypothetical protein ACFU7T_08095 [Streptomyces sp. NPDC057555]
MEYEQMGHKYPAIKGTYQHPTPAVHQEQLDGPQEMFERAMHVLDATTGW